MDALISARCGSAQKLLLNGRLSSLDQRIGRRDRTYPYVVIIGCGLAERGCAGAVSHLRM
jgi:hypothetical protein